jgi:porin
MIGVGCFVIGTPAHAQDSEPATKALAWTVDYKLDLMGADRGVRAHRVRRLDNLDVAADLDLERTIGRRGASAHVEANLTGGASPNAAIGALQGVDNIEVDGHRFRLYQAWIEQAFGDGRASLRLGAYDVSGEFGVLDSAADLIGPSFGFAPELAGGGPAGAAAYPSTALAARASLKLSETSYVQAAVVGATPGALGERGGVDVKFKDGALAIGEAGWTGRGKVAAGAWAFTHRIGDQRDLTPTGEAALRRAWGAYLLVEQPLGERASAFLRAGASDADTQALAGSWQAGLKVQPAFGRREDSVVAFGVAQARLASGYRANQRDAGADPASAETIFELTYADILYDRLRLQPDLQYVRRPGGERGAQDVVILALRSELTF